MPLSPPGAETPPPSPTPSPPSKIMVPSTFYAHQKERIAKEILAIIEESPTSPEAFCQTAEGAIYAICEDRDEGLLIPLVDEHGAPVRLRDLTISARTVRNFLLANATKKVPNAKSRTWRFLYAFLQARTYLLARGTQR